VCPEGLRKLDRERAEAPSRAVHQDPLSAEDVRLAQELQGLASPVGHGRGLLEADVRRHRRDRPGLRVLAQAEVPGMRAEADARRREDPVTGLERHHPATDRLDVAGKLLPEHGLSRPADAEGQADRQPDPGGEVESPQLAVGRPDRRGADPDQDLVIPGDRLGHVPERQDVRRSVGGAHDRSHGSPVRVDS